MYLHKLAKSYALSFFSASTAAIALVSLFDVLPKHFAEASLIPDKKSTDLTAPPALRPLPTAVGLIKTLAALYFASTS